MVKPNIWIFSLEPIDSRYTKQWHEHIPELLTSKIGRRYNIVQIDGDQKNKSVTDGAFLNFSDTNYWKSSQLCKFLDLFNQEKTTPKDKFLFTDAWNPVILQIKYMNDLLDFNWRIHSIFHAGAYDPSDILGYKMEKPWPWFSEQAFFHASSHCYYASEFHRQMFMKNLFIDDKLFGNKAVRSGQPHAMLVEHCEQYAGLEKKAQLIWPHRYNDDKQPEIVEDLKGSLNCETVITQKLNLSKDDYYQEIGQSAVLFSCSLHENLGISVMEGVIAGVIPIVPDRCSYSEMYLPHFKYPSEWTESFESYLKNKDKLVAFINDRIQNRVQYLEALDEQKQILLSYFLNADIMVDYLDKD